MSNKKVSIIVPIYNSENHVRKCVLSLLNQTYSQIEIILINDGSTDGSYEAIEDLVLCNKNILYIYQKNSGVSKARNVGIDIASGEYVSFVDSDDYVDPTYIEKLVITAISHNSDLCICGFNKIKGMKIVDSLSPKSYSHITNEIYPYKIMGVLGRLYKKSFLIENNLYFKYESGSRGEDLPISLFSNVQAKNISVINEALYFYVQHASQSMNFNSSFSFEFPYVSFKNIVCIIEKTTKTENSIDYFRFGVLKTLAHFKYVLYRKAPKNIKNKLNIYIKNLLKNKELEYKESFNVVRKGNNIEIKYLIPVFLLIYFIKH